MTAQIDFAPYHQIGTYVTNQVCKYICRHSRFVFWYLFGREGTLASKMNLFRKFPKLVYYRKFPKLLQYQYVAFRVFTYVFTLFL